MEVGEYFLSEEAREKKKRAEKAKSQVKTSVNCAVVCVELLCSTRQRRRAPTLGRQCTQIRREWLCYLVVTLMWLDSAAEETVRARKRVEESVSSDVLGKLD